ncbi:MAG: hypothetical protein IPM79_22285 [Polyangiaceae bacterium]|nr:hypothetical protein [Polyangiaceae bacterium]
MFNLPLTTPRILIVEPIFNFAARSPFTPPQTTFRLSGPSSHTVGPPESNTDPTRPSVCTHFCE